jgi:hypothetical protein
MSNKLAFFEGMSPEQKGALIGSLMGAGVGGLGGAMGSKKNKLRNSLLAALAGGAGGAGLGYLGGSYFRHPIQDIAKKTAPGVANALNIASSGVSNPALGVAGATTEAIKNLPSKDKVISYFDKLRQKSPFINNYLQGQPAMEETPFQAVPEPMGEEAYSGPLSGVGTAPTGSGADANTIEQAMQAARLLAPPNGPGGAGGIAEAIRRKP